MAIQIIYRSVAKALKITVFDHPLLSDAPSLMNPGENEQKSYIHINGRRQTATATDLCCSSYFSGFLSSLTAPNQDRFSGPAFL